MPLRRITFSGRFVLPKEDAKEDEDFRYYLFRGLLCMVIDIGFTLLVSISLFFAMAGYMIHPVEHGFYCNETAEINKPLLKNTISTSQLLIISLGSPFFIIGLIEALVFFESVGKYRLAKYLYTTTTEYLIYLITYAGCTFMMEFLKCSFGRLRPHFLTACEPDWSKMDCKTDPGAYIAGPDVVCTGTWKRVRTARTSFPSGHTAASVFVCTFVVLYLWRMARVSGSATINRVKWGLSSVFILWTIVTAITRVTDFWHHQTDVLGGFALAFSFVLPVYWRRWTSQDEVYGARQIEKRTKFHME